MDPTPAIPSLDLFSLKGQNVLITGATRGIGAACAIALAQAGASLCLVVRPPTVEGLQANEDKLKAYDEYYKTNPPKIVGEILDKSPGTKKEQIKVVVCDLGDMEDVKSLFPRALALFPEPNNQIHILVNCAGIQRRAKSVDFSEQDWDDAIALGTRTPHI